MLKNYKNKKFNSVIYCKYLPYGFIIIKNFYIFNSHYFKWILFISLNYFDFMIKICFSVVFHFFIMNTFFDWVLKKSCKSFKIYIVWIKYLFLFLQIFIQNILLEYFWILSRKIYKNLNKLNIYKNVLVCQYTSKN